MMMTLELVVDNVTSAEAAAIVSTVSDQIEYMRGKGNGQINMEFATKRAAVFKGESTTFSRYLDSVTPEGDNGL